MNPYELLEKIVVVFEKLDIPYLVTGSVASIAYGEPRLTNDIDIVADIKENKITEFVKFFPQDEFYCDKEMIINEVKRCGQFNIIHPSSGLKADIIIKKNTPFDNIRFKRFRRIYPTETYQANFSSPEDVIIKKMEFYKIGESEKHLRDITGILKTSTGKLDLDYVSKWADILNLSKIWKSLQKRVEEK